MTAATAQPTREQPAYTDFQVRAPEAMRFVFAPDDETGATLQHDLDTMRRLGILKEGK